MTTTRRITNVAIQMDANEKLHAMQVHVHSEAPDPDGSDIPFTKSEQHPCQATSLSDADRAVIEKFVRAAGKIAEK